MVLLSSLLIRHPEDEDSHTRKDGCSGKEFGGVKGDSVNRGKKKAVASRGFACCTSFGCYYYNWLRMPSLAFLRDTLRVVYISFDFDWFGLCNSCLGMYGYKSPFL
jgi:hypothetical protein